MAVIVPLEIAPPALRRPRSSSCRTAAVDAMRHAPCAVAPAMDLDCVQRTGLGAITLAHIIHSLP